MKAHDRHMAANPCYHHYPSCQSPAITSLECCGTRLNDQEKRLQDYTHENPPNVHESNHTRRIGTTLLNTYFTRSNFKTTLLGFSPPTPPPMPPSSLNYHANPTPLNDRRWSAIECNIVSIERDRYGLYPATVGTTSVCGCKDYES